MADVNARAIADAFDRLASAISETADHVRAGSWIRRSATEAADRLREALAPLIAEQDAAAERAKLHSTCCHCRMPIVRVRLEGRAQWRHDDAGGRVLCWTERTGGKRRSAKPIQ